jgi:hypothetical protein
MRIAASIMLMIYGATSLCFHVFGILSEFRHIREPVITILLSVAFYAFIVTGGVLCLKRKYWRVCFASALLAVLIMIYWIYGFTRFGFPPPSFPPSIVSYLLLLVVTASLSIIFVCVRKREWKEISGPVDYELPHGG